MAQTNAELHTGHCVSPLTGFHGTFVIFFVVFLVLALVSMMCLQNWRTWLPGAEGANSMLDGVKSAVYTVISQLA